MYLLCCLQRLIIHICRQRSNSPTGFWAFVKEVLIWQFCFNPWYFNPWCFNHHPSIAEWYTCFCFYFYNKFLCCILWIEGIVSQILFSHFFPYMLLLQKRKIPLLWGLLSHFPLFWSRVLLCSLGWPKIQNFLALAP